MGFRRKLVYVESVRPGSPAAKAGLQADDLIMTVDNQRVSDVRRFRRLMARKSTGTTCQFVVKRGSKVVIVPITLAEPPEPKR